MNSLVGIAVVALAAGTVIGLLLALASIFTRLLRGQISTSRDKNLAYECGLEGISAPSSRVHSGYYLVAVLFVLFDVEIIFLYPWAIAYRDFLEQGEGGMYFGALLIFLGLFILGLFWEIRVKALDWK